MERPSPLLLLPLLLDCASESLDELLTPLELWPLDVLEELEALELVVRDSGEKLSLSLPERSRWNSSVDDAVCSRLRMKELMATPRDACVRARCEYWVTSPLFEPMPSPCGDAEPVVEMDMAVEPELLPVEELLELESEDEDSWPSEDSFFRFLFVFSRLLFFFILLLAADDADAEVDCVVAVAVDPASLCCSSASDSVGKSTTFCGFCVGLLMSMGMSCSACSRTRSWMDGSSVPRMSSPM
mmetsp:Transcript_43809/g.137616  ORF Transcript_43809/g.137616 Transcript_43809/m.137616 type:complete len:242 (-) Transcript_43809:414-1139(-)